MSSKNIVSRETRYAIHIPRGKYNEDTHYVKDHVTYDDGTSEAKISLITDYMRPAMVTKENLRNHREKKEFELRENLNVKMTTDSDIFKTYATMLGTEWLADQPARLKESPYAYMLNIPGSSLIKLTSLMRNNFIQSPYTVAVFDLETDLTIKEPIMGSISQKFDGIYHSHVSLWSGWMTTHAEIEKRLRKKIQELTPEYDGKIILTVRTFDDKVDLLKDLFKVANDWAPDFLSAWNISFDLGESILPMLERRGVNPKDVLCDQELPRQLRRFTYIEGQSKRETSSGKIFPVPPAARWHNIELTARFYFVDSMCSYYQLRIHKGKDPSYAMDAILEKEGLGSKLRFAPASQYVGAEWHDRMQTYHKEEYAIYGVFDNIRPLELDEKNGDLSGSIPSQAGITDFKHFGSSERKSHASLFVYGLERGLIVGTSTNTEKLYEKYHKEMIKASKMDSYDSRMNPLFRDIEESDLHVYNNKVFDVTDWIQTLPQGNFLPVGLKIFGDFPDLITNARGNVVDIDSLSSYPYCTMTFNVSKATTRTELIGVKGMGSLAFRSMNLGLVVPGANSIEYCTEVFGLPTMDELLRRINKGEL